MTKSKTAAINYMTYLAVVGVVVSSAAMFIVLSGFSGLKNYSLEFISTVSPDLKISPINAKYFDFSDEMESFLEKKNLAYSLSFQDKALLSVNNNSQIVTFTGVSKSFPKRNIDSIMLQGRWFEKAQNEVVVGLGTAYDLGIRTMDAINPIVMYVPKAGKGQVFSEKDILRSSRVLASGVFSINEELNNSFVFGDLELARSMFGLGNRSVGSIDVYGDEGLVNELSSLFGAGFNIENRIQQNKTIYKMLNSEQIAVYLVFALIIIVALFNVFGALIMMVIEKRENLQTLIVLGGTKKQVGSIFFYQGGLISFFGCVVGLAAGILLVFFQQKFSLFMITSTLAYPVVFEIKNLLIVFLTVIFLGGLASSMVSFYAKKSILQTFQK